MSLCKKQQHQEKTLEVVSFFRLNEITLSEVTQMILKNPVCPALLSQFSGSANTTFPHGGVSEKFSSFQDYPSQKTRLLKNL